MKLISIPNFDPVLENSNCSFRWGLSYKKAIIWVKLKSQGSLPILTWAMTLQLLQLLAWRNLLHSIPVGMQKLNEKQRNHPDWYHTFSIAPMSKIIWHRNHIWGTWWVHSGAITTMMPELCFLQWTKSSKNLLLALPLCPSLQSWWKSRLWCALSKMLSNNLVYLHTSGLQHQNSNGHFKGVRSGG